MSASVSLEEAQARLKEIIRELAPGDELIITENLQPIAKLISEKPKLGLRSAPGLGKGIIRVISDDEDHLKEFGEYLLRGSFWTLTPCTGTSRAIRNSAQRPRRRFRMHPARF